MPSDFDDTETAVFCNRVLGAESQMLSRYPDAVMMQAALFCRWLLHLTFAGWFGDLGVRVCLHSQFAHA